MATGFTANKNIRRPPWLVKNFGTRRVFACYITFTFITIATMIATIVTGGGNDEKLVEHFHLCFWGLVFINIPVIIQRKYKYCIPWPIYIGITFGIFAHFVLGEVYRFYDNVLLFDKLLHISGGVTIALCGFSIIYGFSKTKSGNVRLSPFFTGLFSFCFAMTLLVLWEFFEYWVDSIGGFNMQRWFDSLQIYIAQTGEIHDFKVLRAWPWEESHRIAITGTADTLSFQVKYFEHGVNGMYLLTNEPHSSGLIDTMQDLIVGSIGALVVSILGALWMKKYPDDKKMLITRVMSETVTEDFEG